MTQQMMQQLMDNMHKQLLQLLIQRPSACTTTTATAAAAAAAAAADDDDDDGGVKTELKHFDDAVFGLLRQVAPQRDFSPCVQVAPLFTISRKLFNLVEDSC